MQLTRQKKTTAVVGLDIEAGSIAATEVRANGSTQLGVAAVEPLAMGVFREGEVADSAALASALKSAFAKHKLSKRVRLGVGNQRVVVRTLRLPVIEDPKELDAAVRFRVQEQMPMPLEEAVLEHQVVGGVPAEEGRPPQIDLVVVAARRDMVASFLEPIRRAGLNPIGLDLSAFGMLRALAGEVEEAQVEPGEPRPASEAVLYCNVGDVANLAVARGRSCLFTRVSNAGLETIAARLSARHNLTAEDASGWLTYVGLDRPVESLDGDREILDEARLSLEDGVRALADELRLSLDYYGAQDGAVPVARVVLCGSGSAIPGLAERMESGFGVPIVAVRPTALADYDEVSAARLTLSYGLALEQ